MTNVLIVGEGGRLRAIEQAMVSPEVSKVTVVGDAFEALSQMPADDEKPFIIFGSESPLIRGDADKLREQGHIVLGACQAATRYEVSYSNAIKLARKMRIPHPNTFIAENNWMAPAAKEYAAGQNPHNYVIRAEGIPEIQSYVIQPSLQASSIVDNLISGKEYGGVGCNTIIFQHHVHGRDIIVTALVGAGKDDFYVLPVAQVYRQLLGGDTEPNTGGMVAYAPVSGRLAGSHFWAKSMKLFMTRWPGWNLKA